MEHKDQIAPPEDLAGYQHIKIGYVHCGDVLVYAPSRNKFWARPSDEGLLVDEMSCDVYRKIACPVAGGLDELDRLLNSPCKVKGVSQKEVDAYFFDPPSEEENEARNQAFIDKHKAKTNDEGKPPLAILPWKALREVALVQAYGQKKYGDTFNYKAGLEVSRQLSCAIRHIADFMDGKDLDSESGRNHLAHAACRILFALENIQDGTLIDNRYKSK